MARAYRATAHALCAVAAFSLGGFAVHGAETQRNTSVVRVIDGDTFVISGGAKVRVRNFDTPELRSYECPEEKRLAMAARDEARRLLQGEPVRLIIDGQDRYKRLVADVAMRRPGGDVDFVATMIENGHGAHWDYGNEPQPDWCAPERTADAAEIEPAATEGPTLDDVEQTVRQAQRVARALEKIGKLFGY